MSDRVDVSEEEEEEFVSAFPSEEEGKNTAPELPGSVSLFQCICAMRDIFKTAIASGSVIIDRGELKGLYNDRRALTMLSDDNFDVALNALYTACNDDESLMIKLREKCVDGRRRRKREREPPSNIKNVIIIE